MRELRQTIAIILEVSDRHHGEPRKPGSVFVLGGNSTTLAFTTSLRAEQSHITVFLLPLARTPVGIVTGDLRQNVGVAADDVVAWLDRTFAPDDPHAFMTPVHDIELLVRADWHAQPVEKLTEEALVNPEDLPDELLDALIAPAEALVQCAVCRRACVRDAFVWNERQLCAWDYHASVFGKRGPWRNDPYEERLFETLPRAAYALEALLDEIDVDAVMSLESFPETAMRLLINTAIAQAPGSPYLAVRTNEGLTLLRERSTKA